MPKTVVVSGASGFVARHLISSLRKRGYAVRALVRAHNSHETLGALARQGCSIHHLRQGNDYLSALHDAYAVINLAGVLTEDGATNRKYRSVTKHLAYLIAAAKRERVDRFIHLSALTFAPESNPYARTKRLQEKMLKNSGLAHYTILRPSLILGKDCSFLQRHKQILRLPRFPLIGDGHYEVQPIFVEDVVRYIIKSMEHRLKTPQTYDICGPETLTYKDLVTRISKRLDLPLRTIKIPFSLLFATTLVTDKLAAYPPLSHTELQLLTTNRTIYAEKAAHQLGITLTPLTRMLEKSL